MRRSLVALALVGALLGTSACSPYLFRDVATAAIITAAIVGTVHIMAHHDAHMHHEYCGHHRRWHHGRWVYHYHGYWEYYDPAADTWYYYD